MFSGDERRVDEIVRLLNAGGCPAAAAGNAAHQSAMGSSFLMPLIAALELSKWSFGELARGTWIVQATHAAKQIAKIVSAYHDIGVPFFFPLIGPGVLRLVVRLAPMAMPFDLEKYMAFHFTKTGPQTRQMLDVFIAQGKARALPVDAIEKIRTALG